MSHPAQALRCDLVATRRLYEGLATGAADRCRCLACRNYLATAADGWPPELVAWLRALGIDPGRENELCLLERRPDGSCEYGLSFYLRGALGPSELPLAPPPPPHESPIALAEAGTHAPASFGTGELVELELRLELPWVLGDEEAALGSH